MDTQDRKLLDIIQGSFPLTPRPYRGLGDAFGITEDEALARVNAMRNGGVIRRLGANFQSKALGFVSTLCAAKVPAEKLEEFTNDVNAHPGVTHNYLRHHPYNVWFTVIAPSRDAVQTLLDGITERTGIPILNLPAKRLYKIRVDFRMGDSE
jgi:DNA-binding Lrp family transcriptional regulator